MHALTRSALAALLLGLLAMPAVTTHAAPDPSGRATGLKADQIVVYKGKRQLHLLRNGAVFRIYRVALGRRPLDHKLQEGDGRTPEGAYIIDSRNPKSNFHLSLHISYPNMGDRARAAALGVSPGGAIMLHGLPNGFTAARLDHPAFDWTDGCIALTNEDIEELWHMVDDGTPILLKP